MSVHAKVVNKTSTEQIQKLKKIIEETGIYSKKNGLV